MVMINKMESKLEYCAEWLRLKLNEELGLLREIKNDWDWYDIPGSLFGFDLFPKPYYYPLFKKCPLNKEQQDNLTQRFSDAIKSNFDVIYNAGEILFINKRFKPGLVEVVG